MKKVICILTVISVIVSCVSLSFAEENDQTITDSIEQSLEVEVDDEEQILDVDPEGENTGHTITDENIINEVLIDDSMDNDSINDIDLSEDIDVAGEIEEPAHETIEVNEETEDPTHEAVEANEDNMEYTKDNVEENIVWENNFSVYKYNEAYDQPANFEESTEEEKSIVEESEYSEMLTDEELEIQAMSEEEGGWSTCGSMTSARSDMSSVAVNDDIYTFGGTESGEVVTKTEMFDTETETWFRRTAMPKGRYKHSAVYIEGKVYICAGYDSSGNALNDIDVYDVESNTWEANPISTPHFNTNYAAGVYNGELYIFGGKEEGAFTRNTYKYNADTSTWTQLCTMPIDTNDGKAEATSRGFYIVSGIDVMKYIDEENVVIKVDELPRDIVDYAFVVRDEISTDPNSWAFKDGDILTVSGGRENAESISLTSVKARGGADFVYSDDWTLEWFNDLKLIRGLSCHNMVIANGYMYVFGGQFAPGQEQRIMFKRSDVEFHDDYPNDKVYDLLAGSYAYGSINYGLDHDYFRFTPSVSGKYEIKPLDAIQTNNMGYIYDICVIDEETDKEITECEDPKMIGGVPMEAGKTYIIEVSDVIYTYAGNYFFQVHMVYDDAPDTLDEAIEIPMERTVSKTFLGYMDKDCMYFDIPITGMYNLETGIDGDDDVEVVVYDENKNLLYTYKYDKNINNESIRFNKGKYYISLRTLNYRCDYDNPGYDIKIKNTAIYKQMNEARYRHGLAAVAGKLYAIGGLNSEYDIETMIESYDSSTGMWTKVTNSDEAIRQGTSAVANGNKIYLVGGVDDYANETTGFHPLDDSIMIYDTVNDTWTGTGDLGIDRERIGLAVKDGDIYIVGGRSYSPTEYSDKIQIFDTATNAVSDYAVSLPTGIVDPQIFFCDDTMYVVGGVDEEGYSSKVYALKNGVWEQKTSMPYSSVYMRGKGYNGHFFAAAVNTNGNVDILKYDAVSDEWTILYENYIKGRSHYGVEILNGLLYITGGYSNSEDAVKADMYSFDIGTEMSSMDSAIPVRTIGFEYEQTVADDITDAPEITGVNAKVIDRNKGIYELYLDENDYTCDTRSMPFFFWSAREGMFRALDDEYRKVMFYADSGTGDRQVKVTVGIGDGRGYVDKKTFLLYGNNEAE